MLNKVGLGRIRLDWIGLGWLFFVTTLVKMIIYCEYICFAQNVEIVEVSVILFFGVSGLVLLRSLCNKNKTKK